MVIAATRHHHRHARTDHQWTPCVSYLRCVCPHARGAPASLHWLHAIVVVCMQSIGWLQIAEISVNKQLENVQKVRAHLQLQHRES